MAKDKITITGCIISQQTKEGIPELRIEAWDKDMLIDDYLGEAITDQNGDFKITFTRQRFEELFFDNKPDIYFKIYADNKLIRNTENSVLWNIERDQKGIKIIIDMHSVLTNNNLKKNTVIGKVTDSNGRSLANLKVEIYDVGVREWQALSDTFTNKVGKYEIIWLHSQLSGRKKNGHSH